MEKQLDESHISQVLAQIPRLLTESTHVLESRVERLIDDKNPIAALIDVERKILMDLQIPAFESLNHGSFLQYLNHHHADLMSELLQATFDHRIAESISPDVDSSKAKLSVLEDDYDHSMSVDKDEVIDMLATKILEYRTVNCDPIDILSYIESDMRTNPLTASLLRKHSLLKLLSTIRLHETADDNLLVIQEFCRNFSKESSYSASNTSARADGIGRDLSQERTFCYAIRSFVEQYSSTLSAEALVSLISNSLASKFSTIADLDTRIQSEVKKALDSHGHYRSILSFRSLPNHVLSTSIERIFIDIASCPVGTSLQDHLQWYVHVSSISAEITLLEFMMEHEAQIADRCPDIRFLSLYPRDDCIPVPRKLPSHEEILSSLERQHHHILGAWIIAAVYSIIDLRQLSVSLRSCLRQLMGDKLTDLIKTGINIGFSVSPSVQSYVIKELCSEISALTELSIESIMKEMAGKLLQDPIISNSYQIRALSLSQTDSYFSSWTGTLAPVESKSIDHGTCKLSSFAILDQNIAPAFVEKLIVTKENKDSSSSANGMTREQFIARLLVREFDYDEYGNPPTIITPHAMKLNNALQHLSAKLYSSDVHFIMELVQNCDDNRYRSSTSPTIKMILQPQALLVYNNEVGFSEENISALCSVGASTKAGQRGYIGQKGIGFKSVFAISHEPEIHSNGFHIKFDRHRSMIEPIWIDGTGQYHLHDPDYETCLRLPLDDQVVRKFDKLQRDVAEVFDDQLILFLNKIHSMIFEDQSFHRSIIHSKMTLSPQWFKIISTYTNFFSIHRQVTESYWYKRTISISNQSSSSLDHLESTDVSIAIKFHEQVSSDDDVEGEKSALSLDLRTGCLPIYAFLPTKICLFPFIIQADFLLSSSRESILEDHDWNQMILRQIPALFCDVFHELSTWAIDLLTNDDNEARKASNTTTDCGMHVEISYSDLFVLLPRYYSLVKESNVFLSVIKHIYQQLEDLPFLLSIDRRACTPKQVYLLQEGFQFNLDLMQVISQDSITRATGRVFLHEACSVSIDKELTKNLQMQYFNQHVIIDCLKTNYAATSSHSVEEIPIDSKVDDIVRYLLALALFEKSHGQILGNRSQAFLSSKQIDFLGSLPIWLTSTLPVLHKLEGEVFLVRDNVAIDRCVEAVRDDIVFLDEKMTQLADALIKDGKNLLTSFLLRSFKSSQSSFRINELTTETVVKRIIIAKIKKEQVLAQDFASSAAVIVLLHRLFSSCNDKFLVLECKKALHDHGIFVPVVSYDGTCLRDAGYRRVRHGILPVEKFDEVMLGFEFESNFIQQLMSINAFTAHHPVIKSYCFLHPNVSALALDLAADSSRLSTLNSISTLFKDLDHSKVAHWRSFLLNNLGLVDAFAVRSSTSSSTDQQLEVPSMFQLLDSFISTKSLERASLPIWLRYDEDGIIAISKPDAHRLQCLLKLCCSYISSLIKCYGKAKLANLLSALNRGRYCPVRLSDQLKGLLLSQHHYDEELVLATSMRNLVVEVDPRTDTIWKTGYYSASSHSLHPHHDFWNGLGAADIANILEVADFILIHRTGSGATLSDDLLVDIFIWMSKRCDTILADKTFMIAIYRAIQRLVSHRIEIQSIIENDEAFIWFPNSSAQSADENEILLGKMFRASQVVLQDPQHEVPQVSSHAAVPVIGHYYQGEDFLVMKEFGRLQVCSACMRLEGLLGARGLPKAVDLESIYGQACRCVDSSFTEHFYELPGLIRISPSLDDLLSALASYRDSYEQLSSLPLLSKQVEEQMNASISAVKSIIASISVNIDRSLRCLGGDDHLPPPYPPEAIFRGIYRLQTEACLLSLSQHEGHCFVAIKESALDYLVIDDRHLYHLFVASLPSTLICIDAMDDSSELILSPFAPKKEDELHFGLEQLIGRRKLGLQQPPTISKQPLSSSHQQVVRSTSSNKLALYKLMKFPLLSCCIDASFAYDLVSSYSSDNILAMFDAILFALQSKIAASYHDAYQGIISSKLSWTTFATLLQMKLSIAQSISKTMTMNLQQTASELTISESQDYHYEESTNRLILVEKLNHPSARIKLGQMIGQVVVSALRHDQTLQSILDDNAIANIESFIMKIASSGRLTIIDIKNILDYEQLNPATAITEAELWLMPRVIQVEDNELSVVDTVDNQEDSTYLVSEDTLAGYERLRQERKLIAMSKAASASSNRPGKAPKDVEISWDQLRAEEECRADLHARLDETIIESNHEDEQMADGDDDKILVDERDYRSKNFEQDPSAQHVIDMQISAADLHEAELDLSASTMHSTALTAAADGSSIGRYGECLAWKKLMAMFPGCEVVWLNDQTEAYLPYDILIHDPVQRLTKYCEVKTRVTERASASRTALQWFISSKELAEAERRGANYFLMLIMLETADLGSMLMPRSVYVIGKEDGLVTALRSEKAHLIIQVRGSK
jgi:hypothetical protein